MRFTDRLRDEDFHRLAQELCPRVAEQLFRLCVDDRDVAIAVDDHDGIRRRFEQAPEFRLAGLQLAQAPERRHVTLADGDQFVARSMQHHLDGNQHAVLAPANGFYGDRTALHDLAQADRGFAAEFVRNREIRNPPADSLFRRVAEHRLCTAIPGHNPAVLRNRQQCIRRRIQEMLRQGEQFQAFANAFVIMSTSAQCRTARRRTHRLEQHLVVEWFGEELGGPCLQRLNPHDFIAVSGHENDRNAKTGGVEVGLQIQARDARHADVRNQARALAPGLQELLRRRERACRKSRFVEEVQQRLAHGRLIVDDCH